MPFFVVGAYFTYWGSDATRFRLVVAAFDEPLVPHHPRLLFSDMWGLRFSHQFKGLKYDIHRPLWVDRKYDNHDFEYHKHVPLMYNAIESTLLLTIPGIRVHRQGHQWYVYAPDVQMTDRDLLLAFRNGFQEALSRQLITTTTPLQPPQTRAAFRRGVEETWIPVPATMEEAAEANKWMTRVAQE